MLLYSDKVLEEHPCIYIIFRRSLGENYGKVFHFVCLVFMIFYRKYFHKVIAQSGTAFNQWVFQKNPEDRSRKLAYLLGCPSNADDALIYGIYWLALTNISNIPKIFVDLCFQTL